MRKKSEEEIRISRESFRVRKTLFAIVAFLQIANLLLIAITSTDFSKDYIYVVALMTILAIFICFDRRKNHINWLYVIIMSTLYFLITAFLVFRWSAYWCLWIVISEFLVFLIITPILYRSYSVKKK
jgi:predicted neutral ceramidase superfamily lipid hydrolase